MAFTRSQATSLLTQAEMGLFDDSRINSLRRLSASELGKRVERARKARDRARDLLQRQKLASRSRTGSKRGVSGQANQRSKRKAELLAEILGRFEGQLKAAEKADAAGKAKAKTKAKTSVRPAARKAPAKQGAAKKKTASPGPADGKRGATPPRKKAGAGSVDAARAPANASKTRQKATAPGDRRGTVVKGAGATSKTASRSKPRQKAAAGRGSKAAAPITPRRALANTRKLLEAKQARERQGQPWQTLDPVHDHLPQPGYQSGQAAEKAEELHSGQSRMTPIEGSISTRDRKNQGKRDRHSGS
ncbi:hypothetical protein BH23PSE2_BH23PSE2_02510 [soil metagenome]